MELQKNAFDFCQKINGKARILIVDDLLATGGTMKAAVDLVNAHEKAVTTHAFVIMELKFINGASKLPDSIAFSSMLSYE